MITPRVPRTEEATRQRLRRFLSRLPYGSKAPFARVCGFADRRRLRAVARFNAYLTPRVARRLNTIMDAVESGQLRIVETSRRAGRGPVLLWQWHD